MTIVSSSISRITVRVRSFRPRFSPLLTCRQVSGPSGQLMPGPFPADDPGGAIARLMLLTEALIP